jgi:hypothetical protein
VSIVHKCARAPALAASIADPAERVREPVQAIGISLLVTGSLIVAYGLLDLFAPGLTTRWQVRSTAKTKGARGTVGEALQQLFGVDPSGEPWYDPVVRRRVRLAGIVLILLGGLVIACGLLLLRA